MGGGRNAEGIGKWERKEKLGRKGEGTVIDERGSAATLTYCAWKGLLAMKGGGKRIG